MSYSEAPDIRRIMYYIFDGAAGQSYGCHAVWQKYDLDQTPVNAPLKSWHQSLDLEVANQVQHLKNLMLSKSYFDRIPEQSLIQSPQEYSESCLAATRNESGTYALIYSPDGLDIPLNLSKLKGDRFRLTWFDPRTGVEFAGNEGNVIQKNDRISIPTQSSGRGNDWDLILDAKD